VLNEKQSCGDVWRSGSNKTPSIMQNNSGAAEVKGIKRYTE
jgi:hypothetical protein